MGKKTKRQLSIAALVTFILILIDQITKKLAVLYLKEQPAIPIIDQVFELKYLENTSAAFGIDPVTILHNIFQFEIFNKNPEAFLNAKMGFFILFTIIIILLFIFAYTRIPVAKRYVFVDYILIFFIAGAIGNFIDRVTNQYVIDFLYFKLINFPIFNVADIYVTCAAFAMFILGIFYYKDEDFEIIFPSKKK